MLASKIGGSIRDDYSGRGMFGRTCYGIDCRHLDEALLEVKQVNLPTPNYDNMGKGWIIYWPSITK